MGISEIGCCGAYCKTCRVFTENACLGCKLGYDNGQREINRARCKIKICCMKRANQSCADCIEYESCQIISEFHHKNGEKYKKYQQAIDYIRENGYEKFLEIADQWKNAFGRYK